jgi:hypothetical protein
VLLLHEIITGRCRRCCPHLNIWQPGQLHITGLPSSAALPHIPFPLDSHTSIPYQPRVQPSFYLSSSSKKDTILFVSLASPLFYARDCVTGGRTPECDQTSHFPLICWGFSRPHSHRSGRPCPPTESVGSRKRHFLGLICGWVLDFFGSWTKRTDPLIRERAGEQPCLAEAEVSSRSSLRSSHSHVSPPRPRLQIVVFGLSRIVAATVHFFGS